jgi:3-phenylpropionate/trans-cinnamate dioxygenase ferredoxin subunit
MNSSQTVVTRHEAVSAEDYRKIAAVADVPSGKTLCVDIDGHEVLLCHTSEGIYAVDNLCTHAAARLCEGKLKGQRILCPLHGAAFDVRDGSVLTRPASVPLRHYSVRVTGQDISVLWQSSGEGD